MVITYHGVEFFRIQFGNITIACNPISKDSKFAGPKFGADIALITTNSKDTNGIEQVTYGEREPFVIRGPGEYEVKEVFIKGLASKTSYDSQNINTVYTINLENMNLCFLGALNSSELNKDTIEAIDEIDILFVPIGGEGVLSPNEAYKLAVSLQPKIIIPMHFGNVGEKDALNTFMKEAGEKINPESKLTLKKKDIEGKSASIFVLSPEV